MLAFAVAALTGGGLALVAILAASEIEGRRARHRIASCFVGEIAGILSAVETWRVCERLASTAANPQLALPEMPRSPLTIYETNAIRLSIFEPPLPRQIALFYTRLGTIRDAICALSADKDQEGREGRLNIALRDLRETLDAGDEVLCALRQIVSKRYTASISRA